MKKVLIIAASATLLAASMVFILAKTDNDVMHQLINANIEALTQDEIIVGDLCILCPNTACTSLGKVYLEHVKA